MSDRVLHIICQLKPAVQCEVNCWKQSIEVVRESGLSDLDKFKEKIRVLEKQVQEYQEFLNNLHKLLDCD